jgi:uncharacterized protein
MKHFKILVTGSRGAGKTSLIRAISDYAPVATETVDAAAASGSGRTTVGLDYGEVGLPGARHVHLYGTPGYLRFKFMRTILAVGAHGAIVLVDGRSAQRAADLEHAIDGVDDLAAKSAVVVGVTHEDEAPVASAGALAARLSARSLHVPVLALDARRREHGALLLNVLLHTLEMAQTERADPSSDSRLFA